MTDSQCIESGRCAVGRHTRRRLLLVTALGLGNLAAALAPARAQSVGGQADRQVQIAQAGETAGPTAAPTVSGTTSENILVRARRQLLKDKNSPSAVTELGAKAIAQTGVGGSIATLLRQAPSVFVYQQGIGNNEPVLTIRGVRGLETAQTLDDVPMQDLLFGGTGAFLQNIIGGRFNLDQISGVSIYPGVAYPDRNTFGTIGGTVAYQSRRPSADQSIEVFGSVGSFKLFNEGFTLNSGALDGVLGSGDNAPRVLLQYSNMQNAGFVDYTPSRYNNMEFAFDKPYDDGLSKFQATVLYNTGNGLFTPEPVPLPYLNKNGLFSNYSPDQEFTRQTNDYLTIILKNDTYINDFLALGGTVFYLNSDSDNLSYANPLAFGPNGVGGSYTVGGAQPFLQVPAGFGLGDNLGEYGPGGVFYSPFAYPYNPLAQNAPYSASCPAAVVNRFGGPNAPGLPCGLNAVLGVVHSDTYGAQIRALITPPEILGIVQNIHVGGLAAKETQPLGRSYFGGTPDIAQSAENLSGTFGGLGFDGGLQRTIYQAYAQDKIDLFGNSLHITPGFTVEGTDSSFLGGEIFGGTVSPAQAASAYCQNNPCLYGAFKQHKWDRDWLPFVNVSYDLQKLVPLLKGITFYGSFGDSALFAPTSDFMPNLAGPPPGATIVHMYEGGIKYNTPTVALSLDYFYQKVDRDFGFFQYQSGPLAGLAFYNSNGQREFKGVEANITWQVTPQIQLFGNASHVLAHELVTNPSNITVQEEQFGDVFKGDPITGLPDWISTFGFDYTPKNLLRDGDGFEARFQGQYTGHQYTTYDLNGFGNFGPLPGGVAPNGTYSYYTALAGATTYDRSGGINPFILFNLDLNYSLPTPELPVLKRLRFDLNLQNLFDHHYYQYFYRQISPASCGTFTSGPFKGQQISPYGCTPEFGDAIPGEPFSVIFTVSARF